MNCWIGNHPGTSGEHIIKASDLKLYFGNVSQKSPIFSHTQEQINKKTNSIKKSKHLKFTSPLCSYCNNDRTSKYDKAWQKLSTHLNKQPINNNSIKLNKIFPGHSNYAKNNIHLYFVKLFGCVIKEFDIPIDLSLFKNSILNQTPHKDLFLNFSKTSKKSCFISDVQVDYENNNLTFATFYYCIGNILVSVIYSNSTIKRQGLRNTWHPKNNSSIIKLGKTIY